MSFKALEQILGALLTAQPKLTAKQPGWEQQQQFLQIMQVWQQIVKPAVAQNTRPLSIARQVLWVATSSSAWAHTLTMQRYQLKQQLNARLSESLTDLRFSPAQWHQNPVFDHSDSNLEHPSRIEPIDSVIEDQLPEANQPQEAWQRWVNMVKARSHNFPLCPRCHTPTPPGELERWSICAYCFATQSSDRAIGSR